MKEGCSRKGEQGRGKAKG